MQFQPPSPSSWGPPDPNQQQPFPQTGPNQQQPFPEYHQYQQPQFYHQPQIPIPQTPIPSTPWPGQFQQQQSQYTPVPEQQSPFYAPPQPPYLSQPVYPAPGQQIPMTPMSSKRPPQQKKSRRNLYIGIAIAVIVCGIIGANLGKGAPSSSTGQSAPTAQATTRATSQTTSQLTSAPTLQPTTNPTQVSSKPIIGNQVVVGGTEDAFNAKFGNPTSQQTQNGAEELFYDTSNSNIGNFGVILIPGTRTVYGIAIGAPTGQPWNATTAISVCLPFMPEDAKLDHPHNVTDSSGAVVGLYQGGHSAELANSLSPSYFNDASGNNLVAPGTFSVKYTYADSSGNFADVCAIRLGQLSSTA